jgi:hypothetical protein
MGTPRIYAQIVVLDPTQRYVLENHPDLMKDSAWALQHHQALVPPETAAKAMRIAEDAVAEWLRNKTD